MSEQKNLTFGPDARIQSQTVYSETLAPYMDRYLQEQRKLGRLARSTAQRRGYALRRLSEHFGRRPLTQFTPRAIERWLLTLDHLSPSSRRQNLTNARTFCKWLIDQGVIIRDPTRSFQVRKPRAVPRALDREKVAQVLAALPDRRSKAIVALMLFCGLRCMEVAGMQTGDYDPHARTLFIKGKGGHERVLPVPEAAARAVDMYLEERGVVSGPLIRSESNPSKGITAGRVGALVALWMRDAGVKRGRLDGVSAHALRHTAGSDVLESSGDLRAVQEMLGHASLTTTQIYLRRASLGQLREAMEGRSYLMNVEVVPSAS